MEQRNHDLVIFRHEEIKTNVFIYTDFLLNLNSDCAPKSLQVIKAKT